MGGKIGKGRGKGSGDFFQHYGKERKARRLSIRDVKASRPNWSRGQKFGLDIGLGTLWLRSQACGPGLELLIAFAWCP